VTVKGETATDVGAAVVQGGLYVVIAPGAANRNGRVVMASANTTAAGLIASLGVDPASVVETCNVPARAHGAFAGPGESGGDIFD
jgi:hypothetical protein